ncbi:MAG: lysine--tRNA ligase, partial [Candidatus Levybacteria bacterium]|nr:lysine--tRNA ligase [Candidatus Levybacteria bacterium]
MQKKSGEQLINTRRNKLDNLRKLNINPYPHSSERQQTTAEAKKMMDEQVVVTGRLMSLRGHGKLFFLDLVDESGKIQLMISEKILGKEQYELLNLLDIGDFVESGGKVVKTVAG